MIDVIIKDDVDWVLEVTQRFNEKYFDISGFTNGN